MKRMRKGLIAVVILCLLGSLVLALALDAPAEEVQTLEGGKLLILGDSYCAGFGLASETENWTNIVAERCGLELSNYSISGSTLTKGGNDPMVERCMSLPEGEYDIIIVQGGSNDWSIGAELGEKDSRDEYTLMGALNVILDHMEEMYPDATLICFTPWVSTGDTNLLGLETTAYVEAMEKLCRSRDILCYDASDTSQNNIFMNYRDFREKYCRSASDRWHLNAMGQALFAEAFTRWLQESLCGVTTADRFLDMTLAAYELKIAVSRVYENGVMYGTAENLFSPTLGATRQQLAVALYRIAGQPGTEKLSFSDVPAEDAAYAAICWAVNRGIMTGEGAFFPQKTLTRAELVSAVYCFYEKAGGEPLKTRSLSQYADRELIPEEQCIPWGWMLKQGLVAEIGDRLAPEGIVSRGELATALSRLMEEL